MVLNFRAREIIRGACKLIRTPTLIKKNQGSCILYIYKLKSFLNFFLDLKI